MKLEFSKNEQQSINYLVMCLIKADGLILPEENVCWNTIAIKMGWDVDNRENAPEAYDKSAAINELSAMDADKKRFALAFFTMIILADQRIAPEEAELIREISAGAQLPEIAPGECADVLESYFA